jgi:hypothetical protein
MNETLWQRVEVELDARRSPFENPALAAALRADPDGAVAVRRLLANLARVSADAPRRARSATRLARTLAVAAGALALASVVWLTRRDADSAPEGTALAYETRLSVVVQHEIAAPARVARVELGPRRVVEWTLEGDRP